MILMKKELTSLQTFYKFCLSETCLELESNKPDGTNRKLS